MLGNAHRVEPTQVPRMTMDATPLRITMFHTTHECAPLLPASAPTTAKSAIPERWNALNSQLQLERPLELELNPPVPLASVRLDPSRSRAVARLVRGPVFETGPGSSNRWNW